MFNPGWALTGFRTILPCFQQVNQTWPRDPIEKPAPGQRSTSQKTLDLDELFTWARDVVTWYWSVDNLFWQVSIDHNMDVQYQRSTQ